jgi:hypothetical protein
MNLAFPALLIFVLVLPGVILRYTYARGTWKWNSATSIQSLGDEVAYSVVIAGALHLLWTWVVSPIGDVDLQSVLTLLAGTGSGTRDDFQAAISSATDHPYMVSGYFLSLYITSACIGYGTHILVRKCHWDRKTRLLRFKNDWHYLLSGEILEFDELPYEAGEPDGVYLSAVVKHGAGDFLYRGIVADWTLDRDGELDRVLLRLVHRRQLSNDREAGQERDPGDVNYVGDARYYDIEGQYFILRYSEMVTVNIEYLLLDPEPETKPPSGLAT